MVVISFFVPLLQDDCMCTLLLLFAWCAMLITLLPIVFFLYQLKYHSKCAIGIIAWGSVKFSKSHWYAIFPVVHECCISSTLTGLLQHSTWSGYPVVMSIIIRSCLFHHFYIICSMQSTKWEVPTN